MSFRFDIPTSYADAMDEIESHTDRWSGKIGYATWLCWNYGKRVILQHHRTSILEYRPNGDIILTPRGWTTTTTIARLNAALPHHAIGLHRGNLRVWRYGEWAQSVPFEEGMVVRADGTLSTTLDGPLQRMTERQLELTMQRNPCYRRAQEEAYRRDVFPGHRQLALHLN